MAPFGASRAGLMSVAEDDIPDSVAENQEIHWRYDEGDGTEVADHEDTHNLDADFTGITWNDSAGLDGWHGVLDGVDDYANLGSDGRSALGKFTDGGEATFTAWIKPASNTSAGCFFGKNRSSNIAGLRCQYGPDQGDNELSWIHSDGDGTATILTEDVGDLTDEWVFYALVLDGDFNMDGYYAIADGDYTVTSGDSSSIGSNTEDEWGDDPHIGASRPDDFDNVEWDGGIDDMRLIGAEISQSDLQEFVDKTKGNYE